MTDDNGTSWLVNGRTGKHIGPFTTRTDALLALVFPRQLNYAK